MPAHCAAYRCRNEYVPGLWSSSAVRKFNFLQYGTFTDSYTCATAVYIDCALACTGYVYQSITRNHMQTALSKLLTYCVLSAQVNSASYPRQDGKWVVAYELQSDTLVSLIWVVVCPLATLWVQWLVRAMDGLIMPISCHYKHCKMLLVTSLTHVSSAVASSRLYLYC